jgi:hypothetical protein
MRSFTLDPSMKTMRGVFYPTGWTLLMFPGEQDARDAAKKLADAGVGEDDLLLVTPQDFRTQILGAAGDDDMLPSAGTEGDTVRRFAELAAQGHHGVMLHPRHDIETERLKEILQGAPISYGQKYRRLVIEDIVE